MWLHVLDIKALTVVIESAAWTGHKEGWCQCCTFQKEVRFETGSVYLVITYNNRIMTDEEEWRITYLIIYIKDSLQLTKS